MGQEIIFKKPTKKSLRLFESLIVLVIEDLEMYKSSKLKYIKGSTGMVLTDMHR